MKHTIDEKDYQKLPQAIGVMAKAFQDGFKIETHAHQRDQLLYAENGVMRLLTDRQAWIIPQGSAVYIPKKTNHAVLIHGHVDMRTLYIDADKTSFDGRGLKALNVSLLLKELILALSLEPITYESKSRGDLIASLIEDEIDRASEISYSYPLPKDKRLQVLCAALIADPSDLRTLDQWAQDVGASVRTLTRLFKKDLGVGFNQWRQLIRFHVAIDELTDGKAIANIAYHCGYSSPSAFSYAFKKVMGCSPSSLVYDIASSKETT